MIEKKQIKINESKIKEINDTKEFVEKLPTFTW